MDNTLVVILGLIAITGAVVVGLPLWDHWGDIIQQFWFKGPTL